MPRQRNDLLCGFAHRVGGREIQAAFAEQPLAFLDIRHQFESGLIIRMVLPADLSLSICWSYSFYEISECRVGINGEPDFGWLLEGPRKCS